MLFCCIPAEGLTFDLIVAFHRGLSCSSSGTSLATHTASEPHGDDVEPDLNAQALDLGVTQTRTPQSIVPSQPAASFVSLEQLHGALGAQLAISLSRHRIEVAL